MREYIGCDAHKRYSVFVSVDEGGQKSAAVRVDHRGPAMEAYLAGLPKGSPIAVETMGSWYWLLDTMERMGHKPVLAHARDAKKLMGLNKTDKMDAGVLAVLLRNGVVPSVWAAPAAVRDLRELPRTRMVLARMRTRLKNRIHATFAKYNIVFDDVSDLFGRSGRLQIEQRVRELPPETRRSVEEQLKLLDRLEEQIRDMAARIAAVVETTPEMGFIRTLPGVGPVLASVIALEIGTIDRFRSPQSLASYAGLVPRVRSSGGKTFFGQVRPDVNRYLKWAFVEVANGMALRQKVWGRRHAVQLYLRLKERRGHPKAVVAVARHLAEATYWMLKKQEAYRDPGFVHPSVSANLA
jgi:transposase